jgi:hypothetical protein
MGGRFGKEIAKCNIINVKEEQSTDMRIILK